MRKSKLGERDGPDHTPAEKKVRTETKSAPEDRGRAEKLIEGISDLSPAEERESAEFERGRGGPRAYHSERLPELRAYHDQFAAFLPLAVAISCALLLPLCLEPLLPPGGDLRALFLERGLTQRFTLAIFGWGLGHCLRLWLQARGEQQLRRALSSAIESLFQGASPRRPQLLQLLDELRESPYQGRGVTVPYVIEVLSYFQSEAPSREEARRAAERAEEGAYDRIDRDYQPLGATLWLLPLNGFLGTVVGMSQSIKAFDALLETEGAGLSALGPSVAGLATAFDTTLLALFLLFPLKLLEVSLNRREQRGLDRLSTLCGAGLVQRLDLRGLAQRDPWAQALEELRERAEKTERALSAFNGALTSLNSELSSLASVPTLFRDLSRALQKLERRLPPSLDQLDEATRELLRALPQLSRRSDELGDLVRAHLPQLKAHLAALEEQGGAPLVIERRPRGGR